MFARSVALSCSSVAPSPPRTNRTDGLHELEDGWFICAVILCMIAWMMLFVSSVSASVGLGFRLSGKFLRGFRV